MRAAVNRKITTRSKRILQNSSLRRAVFISRRWREEPCVHGTSEVADKPGRRSGVTLSFLGYVRGTPKTL